MEQNRASLLSQSWLSNGYFSVPTVTTSEKKKNKIKKPNKIQVLIKSF